MCIGEVVIIALYKESQSILPCCTVDMCLMYRTMSTVVHQYNSVISTVVCAFSSAPSLFFR